MFENCELFTCPMCNRTYFLNEYVDKNEITLCCSCHRILKKLYSYKNTINELISKYLIDKDFITLENIHYFCNEVNKIRAFINKTLQEENKKYLKYDKIEYNEFNATFNCKKCSKSTNKLIQFLYLENDIFWLMYEFPLCEKCFKKGNYK